MIATHDIYLRALAVPAETKPPKDKSKEKDEDTPAEEPKWAAYALVLDTESRITPDQSLTFAVWRLCLLEGDRYEVTEEGILYSDALPAKDQKVLEAYVQTHASDVRCFPPRFPLYSRSKFMQKVFRPALKRNGAMVVGFNLPYDLSRMALEWKEGNKGEWSLIMQQFPNGNENKFYPRINITPIDSKKAFIELNFPHKKYQHEWKDRGKRIHFLDLRTLLWALYNKSYSLRAACDNEDGPFKGQNLPQKDDHEPTGEVTFEEIDYARQDVRCTVGLLNALKKEFDKHTDINLKPWKAYSPASVAKSYLEAMGIIPPAKKFGIPNETLGIAMQTYFGGRSECHIRGIPVPVVPVDFTSEYPTVCALLGLSDVLTAESLEFEDDTDNVRKFLNQITLEGCFEPTAWQQLKFFARMVPNENVLPVRTCYDGVTENIGNNYLSANPFDPKSVWFAGPDLVASVIQTGKVPHIEKAFRMVPDDKQTKMKSVRLRGKVVIDPYEHDIFVKIIEERKRNKADPDLYYWLKILANSIYGFFVELNPEHNKKSVHVDVFSGDALFDDYSDALEKQGGWFAPYLASLITSAGRLLLAMLEASVRKARGTYLFCDTDSLAIVASENGGRLRIPGAKGERILTWEDVRNILSRFQHLNPYDCKVVPSLLDLTDDNYIDPQAETKIQRQLWGLGVASKRYTLFEKIVDQKQNLIDINIINPKAHGIGFLYPPKDNPKKWKKDAPLWVYEMWDYIVRGEFRLKRKKPDWLNYPQMMRFGITTWNVLHMLGEWESARPYSFLFLVMTRPDCFNQIIYSGRQPDKKPLLIAPFSSRQEGWPNLQCIDVHSKKRKEYRMRMNGEPLGGEFVPKTFAQLLYEYVRHPEAKSLGPDGKPCKPQTRGLLQRAHIVAGDLIYVGKETDRRWEEGEDISVIEFRPVQYRMRKVIASETVIRETLRIGIKRCARESGIDRNVIRKITRREYVKRRTHDRYVLWLQNYTSREQSHPAAPKQLR